MSGASAFGLESVRVQGFRSARDVAFEPRAVSALVGEASTGKSNLLAALRALLGVGSPRLGADDAWRDGDGSIHIGARLAGGVTLSLERAPSGAVEARRENAPPALYFPAAWRSGRVLAASGAGDGTAHRAAKLFRNALAERRRGGMSSTAPALAFLDGIERCYEAGVHGLVLLLEEPELFLRPQAQRYLYRLLCELAASGNQVVYSTHAAAFLSVGRLEELVLVRHDPGAGTRVFQPVPFTASEEFRVASELGAERSELFLAHAAVLVEGRTERAVFPSVFRALGVDPDREAISVVDCGGKSNIPLLGRICRAVGVPFLAVHDRDAMPGREPIAAERALNELIAEVAGPESTVVLEPDFEGVAGLQGHNVERAWRHFSSLALADMPSPLVRAARLAIELSDDERGRL